MQVLKEGIEQNSIPSIFVCGYAQMRQPHLRSCEILNMISPFVCLCVGRGLAPSVLHRIFVPVACFLSQKTLVYAQEGGRLFIFTCRVVCAQIGFQLVFFYFESR